MNEYFRIEETTERENEQYKFHIYPKSFTNNWKRTHVVRKGSKSIFVDRNHTTNPFQVEIKKSDNKLIHESYVQNEKIIEQSGLELYLITLVKKLDEKEMFGELSMSEDLLKSLKFYFTRAKMLGVSDLLYAEMKGFKDLYISYHLKFLYDLEESLGSEKYITDLIRLKRLQEGKIENTIIEMGYAVSILREYGTEDKLQMFDLSNARVFYLKHKKMPLSSKPINFEYFLSGETTLDQSLKFGYIQISPTSTIFVAGSKVSEFFEEGNAPGTTILSMYLFEVSSNNNSNVFYGEKEFLKNIFSRINLLDFKYKNESIPRDIDYFSDFKKYGNHYFSVFEVLSKVLIHTEWSKLKTYPGGDFYSITANLINNLNKDIKLTEKDFYKLKEFNDMYKSRKLPNISEISKVLEKICR